MQFRKPEAIDTRFSCSRRAVAALRRIRECRPPYVVGEKNYTSTTNFYQYNASTGIGTKYNARTRYRHEYLVLWINS